METLSRIQKFNKVNITFNQIQQQEALKDSYQKYVIDVENERRIKDQTILNRDLKNIEMGKVRMIMEEGKLAPQLFYRKQKTESIDGA